jgi:hypothetical protein
LWHIRGPETVKLAVESYRNAIAAASGLTGHINNRFCCTPATLVLDDYRQACEYGFRGARFFQESLATYFFSRERVLGPLDVSRDPLTGSQLANAMEDRNAPRSSLSSVIGDPASAPETIARFQAAGVDELILVMQKGTIPHDLIWRACSAQIGSPASQVTILRSSTRIA